MSKKKWTVGDIEISQVVEIEAGPVLQRILVSATPGLIREMAWLRPYFADDSGNLKGLVQSFLVRANRRNVLVDSCNGNGKQNRKIPEFCNLQTRFLEELVEAGASEHEVDLVICTHMHLDHVGWNTVLRNECWVPTFPRATYVFARKEYEYWTKAPVKPAFDDSVVPIITAGLAELVELPCRIDPNIRLVATPGHTPSHMSIFLESDAQRAIITGDLFHHPCQIAHPEWSTTADADPSEGVKSRRDLLEQIADSDILFLGSHFNDPVAGYVRRQGKSYSFEPA